MGKTTRVFQPFEINDLRAMISVMAEITTKGTREHGFNIISPLEFIIIISPLGVLVALVLVASSWLVLWRLIPALLGCCYSCSILSSWHCSMDELGWLYSTVQNFGIVE
jgi:hypothetical protein